jgi:hypothetical protein
VTAAGVHGGWIGGGPGPAAATKIGAATRNALSGMAEAGGELDTAEEAAAEEAAAEEAAAD